MSFQISDDKIAMLIIKRNLPFEMGEPQQTSAFLEEFCQQKSMAFQRVCSSSSWDTTLFLSQFLQGFSLSPTF